MTGHSLLQNTSIIVDSRLAKHFNITPHAGCYCKIHRHFFTEIQPNVWVCEDCEKEREESHE